MIRNAVPTWCPYWAPPVPPKGQCPCDPDLCCYAAATSDPELCIPTPAWLL